VRHRSDVIEPQPDTERPAGPPGARVQSTQASWSRVTAPTSSRPARVGPDPPVGPASAQVDAHFL